MIVFSPVAYRLWVVVRRAAVFGIAPDTVMIEPVSFR